MPDCHFVTRRNFSGDFFARTEKVYYICIPIRPDNGHTVDVAQSVRASDCGSEGRGFEPHLPPLEAVNLLIHFAFVKGAFEALVPSFRFDLTLGIDLCCLAGCGDTGINRSLSFFRDFGLFAEKDYVECCALVHSCMGLK